MYSLIFKPEIQPSHVTLTWTKEPCLGSLRIGLTRTATLSSTIVIRHRLMQLQPGHDNVNIEIES